MFIVAFRRQETYSLKEVTEKIEGIFRDAWPGFRALKPKDTVLIKPNCLSAKPPGTAVTTHPVVLEAVIQILLDRGCRITIGDSPALQRLETVAKKSGVLPLLDRYPVRLQELDDPVEIKGPEEGLFKRFEVSRHCFEFDHIINVAKFKTHSMMGLTLCVKNLFGCIPGRKKAAWHLAIGEDRSRFARMLAELAASLPVDFHLLDGIVGMEGNGPGNGTPVQLGVLLGGENAPAVDAVATRLIGMDPLALPTSRAAAEMGTGPARTEEITLTGDPFPRLPLPFRLPEPARTDWGLPGIFRGLLRRFFLPYPTINSTRCKKCLDCTRVCPTGAVTGKGGRVVIRESGCIRCYCCQEVCPEDAIAFRRKRYLLR
ncbi:MAG: (4Fe-4S)-binding protein [Deltaproteobacteria bacterium]|nr:MAG: (4Fe-4S)-binding protein [Deltaproteobacteria bacterium]